jgi:3-phytase
MGNEELATFGLTGFADDREGISIYDTGEGTGYILVSDQGANKFHVFPREGSPENPHQNELLIALDMNTRSSDGSESTSAALGEEFPSGVFVAMSDNKTFEIYDWRDLLEKIPH